MFREIDVVPWFLTLDSAAGRRPSLASCGLVTTSRVIIRRVVPDVSNYLGHHLGDCFSYSLEISARATLPVPCFVSMAQAQYTER